MSGACNLKTVVKVSFKSNIMWRVQGSREGKEKAGRASLCLGLQPDVPPCLTGNAQGTSRLKIGRLYPVTQFTPV